MRKDEWDIRLVEKAITQSHLRIPDDIQKLDNVFPTLEILSRKRVGLRLRGTRFSPKERHSRSALLIPS